ncbi:hypothetical protein AC1031_018093 [Aphanomyces cochlioides]|nr:hypothetical protein AC1031_018093 [Aphanomyces cochlioides]
MTDTAPSQILDYLFLGGRHHAKNRDQLKALGITHILNVTPPRKVDPVAGVPNFFEKDPTFTYRRCALYDNQGENILASLDGCIAFIDQAKFYGRILVHCKAGVSRSASIVIAYLMKTNQLTFQEALAAVQAKHPMANPNASFRAQLQAFENRLQKKPGQSAPPRSSPGTIGPQLPPHLKRKGPSAKPADEETGDSQSVCKKPKNEEPSVDESKIADHQES